MESRNASRPLPAVPPPRQPNKEKEPIPKKIIRRAGEAVWIDKTLEDWPDADIRLFVSDLGEDVTDDVLQRAFGKYRSLQKVKVVVSKVTGKSRGFGFLSFTNPDDALRAFREMNLKRVGSRPIRIKKAKRINK
jgi:RNA recognition motif-containing protein